MFMYIETDDDFDPAVDFPRHMELSDRCKEWGDLMSGMQFKAPEAGAGDWWTFMEEVYCFQTQYAKFVGDDGPMDLGVRGSTDAGKPKPIAPGSVMMTKPQRSSLSAYSNALSFAAGLAIGATVTAALALSLQVLRDRRHP